jgi:Common central domain of tyrosinase
MHTRRGFLQLSLTAAIGRSQDSISCGANLTGATLYVPPLSAPVPRLRLLDFVKTAAWPQFVAANQILKETKTFQNLANWHYACCNYTANPDIHGNYFFLPWHRMVVHMYERAIRDAAGNPNLSVPYWQWQTDLGVPTEYDSTPALSAVDDHGQIVPRSTEKRPDLWRRKSSCSIPRASWV